LDFPSEPGRGSIPWLFGEYLKDAKYGLEDRLYRVSVYDSVMNFISYYGTFSERKR